MDMNNTDKNLPEETELLESIESVLKEYLKTMQDVQKTNEEVTEKLSDYKEVIEENKKLLSENKWLRHKVADLEKALLDSLETEYEYDEQDRMERDEL